MPHEPVHQFNRSNAKRMRSEMTDAELKLWNAIRAKRLMGLKFRRQLPIGPFIADFACPSARVIVELDGWQHADDHAAAKDVNRTEFLVTQGWRVIRFWNHDVLQDLENVCQHIWIVCEGRSFEKY